jgi:hypothetical protein
MRHPTWSRALAVVTTVVTALTVTWAGSGSAGSASATGVVGASLTADQTVLSGSQRATLTVSVHLTDPSGVQPASGAFFSYDQSGVYLTCPCALLSVRTIDGLTIPSSTQATGLSVPVSLSLASGTAQDGVWSGTLSVGAISAGEWTLTQVIAGALQRDPEPCLPCAQGYPVNGRALGASVNITGSNWPVLRINAFPPRVAYGSPYVVSGSVYYSDSGAPVPGFGVDAAVGLDFLGVLPSAAVHHLRTDSNGRWSLTVRGGVPTAFVGYGAHRVNAGFVAYDALKARTPTSSVAYWVVRVSASSARVPATLTATVSKDANSLILQRRTGTTWAQVSSGSPYSTGIVRFRITHAGSYRVVAPAQRDVHVAAGVSAAISLS